MRQYSTALFVSYVLLRLSTGCFWGCWNRFYAHWKRSDGFVVILIIAACALALQYGYLLVARIGKRGRWIGDLCFVAMACFCLKVIVMETIGLHMKVPGAADWVAKGVLILLVAAFVLFRSAVDVKRLVAALCQMLSPIVLVYAVTLLLAPPVRSEFTCAKGSECGSPRPPGRLRVCLLLFDEWSYDKTFDDNGVRPAFTNISRLAGRSVVYQDARSPSSQTRDVTPSLLSGVVGELTFVSRRPQLRASGTNRPCDEYNHLFKQMAARGGQTVIAGSHLPYAELFQSGVSRCDTYSTHRADGVMGLCRAILLENFRLCALFLSGGTAYYTERRNIYLDRMLQTTHERCMNALLDDDVTFLFAHYLLPHYPFIYDANGLVAEGLGSDGGDVNERYRGNLRYLDRIIGEIVDSLGSSSCADNTILVFLGDHGLRAKFNVKGTVADPEPDHVPVFVLLPGQTKGVAVTTPLRLEDLGALLMKMVDASDRTTANLVRMCAEEATKEGSQR